MLRDQDTFVLGGLIDERVEQQRHQDPCSATSRAGRAVPHHQDVARARPTCSSSSRPTSSTTPPTAAPSSSAACASATSSCVPAARCRQRGCAAPTVDYRAASAGCVAEIDAAVRAVESERAAIEAVRAPVRPERPHRRGAGDAVTHGEQGRLVPRSDGRARSGSYQTQNPMDLRPKRPEPPPGAPGPRVALPGAVLRAASAFALVLVAACGGDGAPPPCEDTRLPFRVELHCEDEFFGPGRAAARLVAARRVVGEDHRRSRDDDALYFQDTEASRCTASFAIDHLGWPPGAPFVEQYLRPDRRFVLGALTYYEEPAVVGLRARALRHRVERAPRPTCSSASTRRRVLRRRAALPPDVGGAAARWRRELPARSPSSPPSELWAGIDYQPLNLGETYGQVRVLTADELATTYVGPREIVVLDRVPNDLTVVAGVVDRGVPDPVVARQRPVAAARHAEHGPRGRARHLRAARGRVGPPRGRRVRLRDRGGHRRGGRGVVGGPRAAARRRAAARLRGHRRSRSTSTTSTSATCPRSAARRPTTACSATSASRCGCATPLVVPVGPLPRLPGRERLRHRDRRDARRSRLPRRRRRPSRAAGQAPRQDAGRARRPPASSPRSRPASTPSSAGTRLKLRSSTNAEDLAHHTGAGLYESRSAAVGDPTRPVDRRAPRGVGLGVERPRLRGARLRRHRPPATWRWRS